MADDLISRQAAIDLFPNDVLEWDTFDGYIAPHVVRRLIEDLPSAQRTGKWLDDGQYDNFFPHHEWRCSECGEHVLEIGAPWFKYCPTCGARMDAERKEE